MKRDKIFCLMLGILFFLPLISSLELNVKPGESTAMIMDFNDPSVTNLQITTDQTTSLSIYNLLGFEMEPSEKIAFTDGKTQNVELKIYPRSGIKYRGFYTLTYYLKDSYGDDIPKQVTFKITDLKDAFEIGAESFDPESNTLKIYFYNKENFNFTSIKARFSSPFFEFERTFSMAPYEKKTFEVQLNKEDYKKLLAGFYTAEAEVTTKEKTATVIGTLEFKEKNIVTTTSNDLGLIVSTKTITKTNEGNVPTLVEMSLTKNIISRLFTTISPEPTKVARHGFSVDYTWNKEIQPGESLDVVVKTNWLYPFLIILLIIGIIAGVKQLSKTDVAIRKKVSFVNAKGGEFALKVTIAVSAKRYVEKVNVIDRLPPLVKLYEKFGAEKPTRTDEKNRRLEWTFNVMDKGETRYISYVIYSKVGVLGKFALPPTTAVYEREGKVKEVFSNRAFFVAEQRSKDLED